MQLYISNNYYEFKDIGLTQLFVGVFFTFFR
jgi:hypothetical protein